MKCKCFNCIFLQYQKLETFKLSLNHFLHWALQLWKTNCRIWRHVKFININLRSSVVQKVVWWTHSKLRLFCIYKFCMRTLHTTMRRCVTCTSALWHCLFISDCCLCHVDGKRSRCREADEDVLLGLVVGCWLHQHLHRLVDGLWHQLKQQFTLHHVRQSHSTISKTSEAAEQLCTKHSTYKRLRELTLWNCSPKHTHWVWLKVADVERTKISKRLSLDHNMRTLEYAVTLHVRVVARCNL